MPSNKDPIAKTKTFKIFLIVILTFGYCTVWAIYEVLYEVLYISFI